MAGDHQQGWLAGLVEERLRLCRELLLGEHPDVLDDVVDVALVGVHDDRITVLERLQVLEGARPGVDGVPGDECRTALRAGPGALAPPADNVGPGRRAAPPGPRLERAPRR